MELDPFLLKKLVSLMVHLVPGVPIAMLIALLLLRWLPRLARRCLWLGISVLLLCSSPLVSNALVSSLEERYPPLQQLPADTAIILVLGSGHQYGLDRSVNSMLSATSLSRVTEGVRLWKGKQDALLVTSGIGLFSESSNAEASAVFALANGVPQQRIRALVSAHDTEEEIRLAAELLTADNSESATRLVIVSSATHLARADQLARQFDLTYTLAPTDFLATGMPWYRLDSGHLRSADRALHEYVGMLWHWLKLSALNAG